MTAHTVLLALIVLVVACTPDAGGREPPEQTDVARAEVPGLETELVTEETISDISEAPCTISASPEATEVQDARTQLAEAEARRRLAAQQVRRLQELSREAIAPRRELEAARAEEAAAEAAAERYRKILASFGSDALRRALAPDEIWGLAHLLQRDVGRVAAAAELRFRADAEPGHDFEGRVDAPAAYVEPVSGLAPVRVRLRDPEHLLRPGMTGVASIAGPKRAAFVVPTSALVYDGEQSLVWVEVAPGRFEERSVRVGAMRDSRVEVTGDVAPGARVATTGAASLLSARRLAASSGDEE